jgi:hypothetical protein
MKKFRHNIILSVVSIVLFIFLLELTCRVVIFQFRYEHVTAIQAAISGLRGVLNSYIEGKQRDKIADFKKQFSGYAELLYAQEGKKLLTFFQSRYEADFDNLVGDAQKIGSKLVILYIPSTTDKQRELICRAFFSGLAAKHGLDFVDTTDALRQYDMKTVFLLPENSHLSRFGNQLIAIELKNALEKYSLYRSSYNYSGEPVVCGDLPPQSSIVRNEVPTMPYRVTSNRQGFRTEQDVAMLKTKQRILVLGDSFTFGPYLSNHDTYPAMLAKLDITKEVFNAGIAGYTIMDEASLFVERAKYVSPDITVLQVLDNDITDYFWFQRNIFDRKHSNHEATRLESEFLNMVLKKNKAVDESESAGSKGIRGSPAWSDP